jgi:hypothetical protein
MELKKPYTVGQDVRGDRAIFIPYGERMDNPTLVKTLKSMGAETAYVEGKHGFVKRKVNQHLFRFIDEGGGQLSTHGWIRYNPKKKLAEIIQWG